MTEDCTGCSRQDIHSIRTHDHESVREKSCTICVLEEVSKVITKFDHNLENSGGDLSVSPVYVKITEAIAKAIWIKVDVSTQHLLQRSDQIILTHFMDEFLLLNNFIGPTITEEGVREFDFQTDHTGDNPFKFNYTIARKYMGTYEYFEIKLTRDDYTHGRFRAPCITNCTIPVNHVPPLVDATTEADQVFRILKRLTTDHRKTFCFLKCDNTPSTASVADTDDELEDFFDDL